MQATAVPLLDRTPSRIGPAALRRALIAGMRRVVAQREALNRINVFPVPDGDTGSNLAFTLGSVLGGGLSRPARSVGELLRRVADDAIDGARGNSGAILAQFFCGVSESTGQAAVLTASGIARAAAAGAQQARGALAQPREGTILSVIRAFADALQEPRGSFRQWFGEALESARRALADTPKQLAVLRQAGVVDAGAQGFVDLLEGIHEFLLRRTVDPLPANLDDTQEFAGEHWHDEADASRPWCSECLIEAEAVDRAALQAALADAGADSVVVAGGLCRVRIHAHVADPGRFFELAGRFGRVSARKAEDMRAQHRVATRGLRVAVVTDSAADLPNGIGETLPLDIVPVRLSFGDEDFLDRVSISAEEFHRRLREDPVLPQTSQPPPGDFRRQFELLLAHAEQVVYVGLSRALSGTLQAGESAAERIDPARIRILDSGQASCGQALLAITAAECAAAGGDADAVAAAVAAARPQIFLFALARDVGHAVRGGRVPGWILPLARTFGLSAMARMRPDGRIGVCGALFGQRDPGERFARQVLRRLPERPRWRVMVGHCGAATEGERLREALCRELRVSQSWLVEAGPAIGVHTGPGALVVGLQALPAES